MNDVKSGKTENKACPIGVVPKHLIMARPFNSSFFVAVLLPPVIIQLKLEPKFHFGAHAPTEQGTTGGALPFRGACIRILGTRDSIRRARDGHVWIGEACAGCRCSKPGAGRLANPASIAQGAFLPERHDDRITSASFLLNEPWKSRRSTTDRARPLEVRQGGAEGRAATGPSSGHGLAFVTWRG